MFWPLCFSLCESSEGLPFLQEVDKGGGVRNGAPLQAGRGVKCFVSDGWREIKTADAKSTAARGLFLHGSHDGGVMLLVETNFGG